MRLGLFGCYDEAAPRLVTLLRGFTALGGTLVSCHEPGFDPGFRREAIARHPFGALPGLALAQARLWRRRAELRGVGALLVPYPGHFTLPLARAVARGLQVPVLFDPFLSLYDTVVCDRALLATASWRAGLLKRLDRLALGLADQVLADTPQMAAYYSELAELAPGRVSVVPIGVDTRAFPRSPEPEGPPYEVLFVGHMLPLHGVATILAAAQLLTGDPRVTFHLVGTGPFDVAGALKQAAAPNVRYTPGVPFEALGALMAGAHICLGAFGTSEKARRVVPHKVFQAAACGRALITGDTPAAREAFGPDALTFVPPGDARALADAISLLVDRPGERLGRAAKAHDLVLTRYDERMVGARLVAALEAASAGSFHATAGMS